MDHQIIDSITTGIMVVFMSVFVIFGLIGGIFSILLIRISSETASSKEEELPLGQTSAKKSKSAKYRYDYEGEDEINPTEIPDEEPEAYEEITHDGTIYSYKYKATVNAKTLTHTCKLFQQHKGGRFGKIFGFVFLFVSLVFFLVGFLSIFFILFKYP